MDERQKVACIEDFKNTAKAVDFGRIPIFPVMQPTMRYVNSPFVSNRSIVLICSMNEA